MKLGLNLVSLWFGVLMVIIVLSGAIVFAFTDFWDDRLYGTKRTIFVFVLLAYGIYRSFRIYQVFKKANSGDE